MPRYESRLRYVDHVKQRGRDVYRLACRHDAEGIVAKWSKGTYSTDGATTSWLKVKNPDYTQMAGRHELFEGRGLRSGRAPRYRLDPAAGATAL